MPSLEPSCSAVTWDDRLLAGSSGSSEARGGGGHGQAPEKNLVLPKGTDCVLPGRRGPPCAPARGCPPCSPPVVGLRRAVGHSHRPDCQTSFRLSYPPVSRPKAQRAAPTPEQEALGLGSGSDRGLDWAPCAPGFPSWSVNSARFRLSVRQRPWSLPLGGSFWGEERQKDKLLPSGISHTHVPWRKLTVCSRPQRFCEDALSSEGRWMFTLRSSLARPRAPPAPEAGTPSFTTRLGRHSRAGAAGVVRADLAVASAVNTDKGVNA